MEVASGSLVIVDAHTESPSVFFKGKKVDTVEGIKITWDADTNKVMLIINNTDLAAEMAKSGIKVRVAA